MGNIRVCAYKNLHVFLWAIFYMPMPIVTMLKKWAMCIVIKILQ